MNREGDGGVPSLEHLGPDTVMLLSEMLAEGLFLDPPLVGMEREQYTGEATALLTTAADDLADRFVIVKELNERLPGVHWTSKMAYTAIFEFMASTATLIAHTRLGKLQIGLPIAKESIGRVEAFLRRHSFIQLYRLYGVLSTYFNLQAIGYYGLLTVHEFMYGQMHRPWVADTLEDELQYLLSFELIRKFNVDDKEHVALTALGYSLFDDLHTALDRAKYLTRRVQLLAVSHFDSLENLDELQREAWPNAAEERQHFLSFVGVKTGMHVLEFGIGTANLTVDGGLARLVLPKGNIVGVDISVGMLERAATKLAAENITHVQLLQADVQNLPIPDDSFDCALGYEVLHLTDLHKALRELQRVTRSGGSVATAGPVLFDWNAPFFQEWFSPLIRLSTRQSKRTSQLYIPQPFEVEQVFRDLGYQSVQRVFTHSEWVFSEPQRVIQYVLQGVALFREELLDMPWRAKEELIQDLYRRGVEVCKKYTPEERHIHLPGEYVIGVV